MENKWVIAGLIILTILIVVYFSFTVERLSSKNSLYERLGGIYSIAAVVDHFSDNLIKNPVVGVNSKNPQLRQWNRESLNRLPGLKWMRTLWVASVSGGPYKFIATKTGKNQHDLSKAHEDLKITSEEFDEVAVELKKSLDHFNVPSKEQSEVLGAFSAHKQEVVSGGKCPFA